MNLYQFATESPFLAFFLTVVITHMIFLCWNRLMRHLNVKANGWPPEHLDADGDFKESDDA